MIDDDKPVPEPEDNGDKDATPTTVGPSPL